MMRLKVRVRIAARCYHRVASVLLGACCAPLASAAPPDGYRGPDEGSAALAALADRADRALLVRLGASVEGRPIEGLALGVPPGEGAPSFRVLGAHHGDEPITAEVVLELAEALLDDPRGDEILDRATVWLVPYVSPDGVAAGSRTSAAGVDLNRNYDHEWRAGGLAGTRPFSEPETRAVRALGDLERTVLGLTLHAGAANLGWPWNHTTDDPPDADAFAAIASVYARDCDTPGFWTTQGGDWFRSNGDLDDWTYGRHGELDLTLEVSPSSAPPDVPAVVDEHLDALLAVLALAPPVTGRVVDAVSGAPVEAVLVHDGGAPFRADAATGAFARLAMAAGALSVSAPGYAEVEVAAGEDLVVALDPVALREGRVTPAVLREPARLDLPPGATLIRPGADPVGADAVLDPGALAPGWWTVVLADGGVLPRAVFVDGPEDGVAIDRWRLEGGLACIEGAGFADGARAWALWGRERAPVELPVTSLAPDELCVDVASVPLDEDPDLALWTAGARLGLDHLWDPRDVGVPADEGVIPAGECGCAPIAGHRGGSALSIVLGWTVARTRRGGRRCCSSPR